MPICLRWGLRRREVQSSWRKARLGGSASRLRASRKRRAGPHQTIYDNPALSSPRDLGVPDAQPLFARFSHAATFWLSKPIAGVAKQASSTTLPIAHWPEGAPRSGNSFKRDLRALSPAQKTQANLNRHNRPSFSAARDGSCVRGRRRSH
jgi:hypothetical protein